MQFAGQRGTCSGCGASIQLPRACGRVVAGRGLRLVGLALGLCTSVGLIAALAC